MITAENFKDVVNSLSDKDKIRINNAFMNSTYEYVVIELHTFNVGSYTTCKLTNDYNKYQNVSNNGNCILPLKEVYNTLNSEHLFTYKRYSDITGIVRTQ